MSQLWPIISAFKVDIAPKKGAKLYEADEKF